MTLEWAIFFLTLAGWLAAAVWAGWRLVSKRVMAPRPLMQWLVRSSSWRRIY